MNVELFLEVYIDEGKKSYRDLNYRRFNLINIWKALLSRISRATISEARGRGISGNFSGDGLQNGGLLIVSKQGMRILLNHREEVPGDHVANDEILRVLGITEVKPSRYSIICESRWLVLTFPFTSYSQEAVERQEEAETAPDCTEECAIPKP